MSNLAKIHVGDIGTIILVTVTDQDGSVLDISSASTREIKIQKADGSGLTKIKTASFTTDGADGKIQFVTIEEDFNSAGEWTVQGRIVLPAEGTWSTSKENFYVASNI
ncbi:MAG: hypothetical protein ACTSVP_03460 [Candidatus Heimdallarchaeota archaeon]